MFRYDRKTPAPKHKTMYVKQCIHNNNNNKIKIKNRRYILVPKQESLHNNDANKPQSLIIQDVSMISRILQ